MRTLRLFLIFICLWIPLAGAEGAESHTVTVRYVIDGDTVVLSDGRHLRYIGIDAPEIAHDGMPAEPFAEASRRFNQELVSGVNIRLELEEERKDRYGRLLSHLRLPDGRLAAEALLAAGLAHCLPNRPNTQYAEKFLELQQEAMDHGRGKWHRWQKVPGPFAGNRQSLRVHRENCPFGRRIGQRNRVRFASLWQAFHEGYAPCKVCLGGN